MLLRKEKNRIKITRHIAPIIVKRDNNIISFTSNSRKFFFMTLCIRTLSDRCVTRY